MIWETIGIILSSLLASIFLVWKIKKDVFPRILKKSLYKLALSNWQRSLQQKLPKYELKDAKTIQETGILPTYLEYGLEKPRTLGNLGEKDTWTIYGIDDIGNAVVVRISRFWNDLTKIELCLSVDGNGFSVAGQGKTTSSTEFSIGNFRLEMVQPLKCWRIWFNGAMGTQDQAAPLNHVTVNFLWKPLDNPYDLRKDANINIIADSLSSKGSFGSGFTDLLEMLEEGYIQFGSLHGTVSVDGFEHAPIYLYGQRRRTLSTETSLKVGGDPNYYGWQTEFFGMADNGNAFRMSGYNDDWVDGWGYHSSFAANPINKIEFGPAAFRKSTTFPKLFTFSDKKSSTNIEVWPKYKTISPGKASLEVVLLKLLVNGKPGRGLLLRHVGTATSFTGDVSGMTGPRNDLSLSLKPIKSISNESLFVPFNCESCLQVSLVGGKGASLAKIAMSASSFSSEFQTAQGFCITTNIFRNFIDAEKVRSIIDGDPSDLNISCLRAISFITESVDLNELKSRVRQGWYAIFKEELEDCTKRFAVRSSGVLEDGSDLSCAGQNETFLGVEATDICQKVVECWASLFTFQSVSYRLNHGQPIASEMGVVIQEMVDASVAGVLFTADPRTGNPFEMFLTANYGLGESVVSGSADPDTITILRPRGSVLDGHELSLKIGTKFIGEKKTKVVLSSVSTSPISTSTREEKTTDEESNRLCTTDDLLLKLGLIGVHIENQLGDLKPVDIEWAISKDGKIYILQCRPMTSLDSWTDFEIAHEFDTAIRSKNERLTTANTGEVMPKPLYPISIQTIGACLDISIQKTMFDRNERSVVCHFQNRGCSIYGQRTFINMLHCLYQALDEKPSPAIAAVELTIFGRGIMNEELHEIGVERHGTSSSMQKLKMTLITMKTLLWTADRVLNKANERFGNFTIDYETIPQNCLSVYEKISASLLDLVEICIVHCTMSGSSSAGLVLAFMVLSEAKEEKDWTPSLYEDAGKLLSAYSTVESAEMPTDMEELVKAIECCLKNKEGFLNSKNTKEAVDWLHEGNPTVEIAWNVFLKKHGHRSIAELDVGQTSWETEPSPLIGLLKNGLRNQIDSKTKTALNPKPVPANPKFTNDDELLDSLKTPLKSVTKRILKVFLPYCRLNVVNRERSKSLLVRTIDQLKQGYYKLAKLMATERLIPDETLLRFLVHEEIKLLLHKDPTTPTILNKALRRMKMYPKLEDIEYLEINVGVPKPIDTSTPVEVTDVLKGTPVSSGRIQGTAKVCLSVEQASEIISKGDILITRGTDIAWSPFFPLLGGVVTELGGLISHGAVVAREYGLPCIIGAVNATKIFKTGETVILDTSNGTISKVKHI